MGRVRVGFALDEAAAPPPARRESDLVRNAGTCLSHPLSHVGMNFARLVAGAGWDRPVQASASMRSDSPIVSPEVSPSACRRSSDLVRNAG